jgi:hypothetical protein
MGGTRSLKALAAVLGGSVIVAPAVALSPWLCGLYWYRADGDGKNRKQDKDVSEI